jgi:hypothetical protein
MDLTASERSVVLPPFPFHARPDLGIPGKRPSRWVTREKPKVERIACPWLIRRFLDPHAEFFFVADADVRNVSRSLDATPFDVPDVQISHRWEKCSFDALLDAFKIDNAALRKLAIIVRAADTSRLSLSPQSAGLLAISLGLSRLYPDDHQMLAAGMLVYDALYERCGNCADEQHGWIVHV